ncbi:NT5DC1 [Cordylochernes scorpioides]|uniref:NT5DC1 n=1 Tax=Cordylochernes scorpioides TaxID=51811 RepID=A0ABY6LJA4_9ARAC|nr:NT5DC1 [Cordylochernes scorpioides]
MESSSSSSFIQDGFIHPAETLIKAKNHGFLLRDGSGFRYNMPERLEQVLANYDAVGFDMDHTLCHYNLESLNCILYKLHADFLIGKKGYNPKFLRQSYASGKHFIQKGLILDKQRGNILKISHDHRILRGYHGTNPLGVEELKAIYGSDLKWKELEGFPQKQASSKSPNSYYIFYDFFVVFASLICTRIVDTLDSEAGPQEIYNFWSDVYEGLEYIFSTNGGFYENLLGSPELYIKKSSPAFKSWLQSLNTKHRTKLFLLSNSPMDFVSFLCSYCLGPSWNEHFDIVITDGDKPSFFMSDSNFQIITQDTTETVSKENLTSNIIYSKGNWKDLLYFFNNYSDIPLEKVIYFGDSFLSDIFSPVSNSCCHTAAIVEELQLEGLPDSQDGPWGSFFKDKFAEDSSKEVVPLCYGTICHNATLIIPSLDDLAKDL